MEQRQTNSLQVSNGNIQPTMMAVCHRCGWSHPGQSATNHTLGPFNMFDSCHVGFIPPSECGKMPLQTLYSSYTVTKLLVGCGSVVCTERYVPFTSN